MKISVCVEEQNEQGFNQFYCCCCFLSSILNWEDLRTLRKIHCKAKVKPGNYEIIVNNFK